MDGSGRSGMVAGEDGAARHVSRPEGEPAYDWAGRNLRNFVARGRPFAPLPPELARTLGPRPEAEPEAEGLRRLADALAGAVGRRHAAKPTRAEFVDVPHAIALADLESRRMRNAAAAHRRAALRHMPIRDAHDLTWLATTDPRETTRLALVECGPALSFRVRFDRYPDGTWEQGWSLTDETEALMRSHGLLSGTGWFARIDAGVRDATRQFLEDVRPVALVVRGADGKRNAHNAATYGSILPEGYALHPMVEPGHPRADARGVVGVGLVRLPAYAPLAAPEGRPGPVGPQLAEVRDRLGAAPVDVAWMHRVIGPTLWKGRSLPKVPGRLAGALGIPERLATTPAEVEAVLGAALHAACDERRAGRGTERLTLAKALAIADRQAAELPDRAALEAAAAGSSPEVSFRHEPGGHRVIAEAEFGPIRVEAVFGRQRDDSWSMGWRPDGPTQDLARRLHAMRPLGAKGTGLFPLVDRGVRAVIDAFLEQIGPETLRLDGLDARSNDHYAKTFGSIAPDGYALMPIVEPERQSAGEGGVVAVRFERLPEPLLAHSPA